MMGVVVVLGACATGRLSYSGTFTSDGYTDKRNTTAQLQLHNNNERQPPQQNKNTLMVF